MNVSNTRLTKQGLLVNNRMGVHLSSRRNFTDYSYVPLGFSSRSLRANTFRSQVQELSAAAPAGIATKVSLQSVKTETNPFVATDITRARSSVFCDNLDCP